MIEIIKVILNPDDGYLYQLCDDKIEIGDWDYSPSGLPKVQEQICEVTQDNRDYGWRKIIRTNNPKLETIKKLPSEINLDGSWRYSESAKKYQKMSLAEEYSYQKLVDIIEGKEPDWFDHENMLYFTAQDIEEAFKSGQTSKTLLDHKNSKIEFGRGCVTIPPDIFNKFGWCLRDVNGESCVCIHEKDKNGASTFSKNDFITAIPIENLTKL